MSWISVEEKYPEYGKPILIVVDGVAQNIVYVRGGSDDSKDWCEPFYFEHDGGDSLWWEDVTHWMAIPQYAKEEL